MIKVNNWEQEYTVGMTIEDLLKRNNYTDFNSYFKELQKKGE